MKLQYRIKSSMFGIKYLQFKRKGTWRYIPDSYVANVFSIAWCPFYLPFITSHCYLASIREEELCDFAKKYPYEDDLKAYLSNLKQIRYNQTEKITYL